MRKRVIVPYIFICLILIHCSQATAWANSSYANDSSNYDYTLNYATHDWVAQKALEILLDDDYSKWEWLKDRELIYLTGTEAPDNVNVNMNLDGEVIQGFGDFDNHFVYFHENGSVKSYWDKAAVRAQSCSELADKSLLENKLDQAAFYFGAMTHYISDCSVYAHIAQSNVPPYNVNFNQWHSTIESRVRYRTNNYYDREEFFNYTAQNVEKNSAYNITLEIGWDTYKDPTPSEATVRDAFWLHNNFFSDWVLTYNERIAEVNQTRILYYDRIEENLNKAIEGCIAAINYSATTQTVHAMKDAHVYSRFPNNNYGDWDRMYCGNSQTYQNEDYIYFNISSQPTNWKKAELFLYITDFPVAVPLDFEICQIMESWDESLITWNNKPAHGTFLATMTISKNEFNKIDVTSIISGDSFSICIYADVSQWETIRIHSTENTSISLRPKLIFTYEDEDDIPPSITINSPATNQIFGTETPSFDITLIEESLNSTWYTLDGGLTNFTFTGTIGTINQTVWDAQPNGTVIIRFYANDSVGNMGFAEVSVFKDILAPNIIINSPSTNQLFGLDAPVFDITIIEGNLNITWYTLDNGLTNYTVLGASGTINQAAWDAQPNGTVKIRFYANDTIGNLDASEVTIRKDIIVPILIVNSPTPNHLFGVDPPTFNVQIQEPNLQEKWYSLNGGQNITFTTQTEFDQTEWNKVGNGTVVIKFYALDKGGNMNFSVIIVRKDAYVPEITIYSPLENETFGKTAPDFNISLSEDALDSTWYTIEGVALDFYFTELNGSIDQEGWNNLTEGEITISFFARDAAGNIGTRNIIVIKHIPPSSTKDLLLITSIIIISSIGGAIGVSGIVIVLQRKKILNLKKYYEILKNKLKKAFKRKSP